MAFLLPRPYWDNNQPLHEFIRATAPQLGIRLTCLCVAGPQEAVFRQVFAGLNHDKPDAIIVPDTPESFTVREVIVDLVNTLRTPATYPAAHYAELGGLNSYGHDLVELFRHMARQMDMILRGRPVSEVPWYQLTTWELVVNLRTAKMLGIEMPPSVLVRADKVID